MRIPGVGSNSRTRRCDVAGVHVGAPLPLLLRTVGPPALKLGRSRQERGMGMHGALRCQLRGSQTQLVEGRALLPATRRQSLERIVNRPARALLLAGLRV
jgi:hypothetical protein